MKRAITDQHKWIVPRKHLMFDNFLGDAMKASVCVSKRCFTSKKEKAKKRELLDKKYFQPQALTTDKTFKR